MMLFVQVKELVLDPQVRHLACKVDQETKGASNLCPGQRIPESGGTEPD